MKRKDEFQSEPSNIDENVHEWYRMVMATVEKREKRVVGDNSLLETNIDPCKQGADDQFILGIASWEDPC